MIRIKKMLKINVCDIDSELHASPCSFSQAMKDVVAHIQEKYDPSFSEEAFMDWVDSDSEKPFRWNNRLYYWSVAL